MKLSPYRVDDLEISRILFLDAEFIRRNERYFRFKLKGGDNISKRCGYDDRRQYVEESSNCIFG